MYSLEMPCIKLSKQARQRFLSGSNNKIIKGLTGLASLV